MALVRFEQDGTVGRVILARPEAGSAVTPALIVDLGAAVDAAEGSPSRAILVTAEGANFCLGADLKHLAAADSLATELDKMANAFHSALARLFALPLPIIAAVQGNAIGGGFGLALAADFLICAEDARFSTGYARLGLSADAGVSFFLTRTLGMRRARTFLIDPRFIPAEEALALGIAYRTAPASTLDRTALEFARQVADGPTSAFAAIKRLTEAAVAAEDLSVHLEHEAREIVTLAAHDGVRRAIRATLDRARPIFDR